MKTSASQILLIDNEDSFTWNLFQLFEEAGATVTVKHPKFIKNGLLDTFDGLLISPGPGLPEEMFGLLQIISEAAQKIPVLGVCLGHQALAMSFGAQLFRMETIIHGHQLEIDIVDNRTGIFKDVKQKLNVGLYHSWAIDKQSLPDCFQITAISSENIIMGICHKSLPLFGVQFHPESFISEHGETIALNWLKIVAQHKSKNKF